MGFASFLQKIHQYFSPIMDLIIESMKKGVFELTKATQEPLMTSNRNYAKHQS